MTQTICRLLAVTVVAAGALVFAPPASATTTSVNCDQQALQAQIDQVASGSTLLLTGTCHGSFVVAKDITLKGNPKATLDGDNAGRTLTVTGVRAIVLKSLVVTGGLAAQGAGIDMENGGSLTLDHVTVRDNEAAGATATGGGIMALKTVVSIQKSRFLRNRSIASGSGLGVAQGGAMEVQNGSLTIADSIVRGNEATAVSTASLAEADGGAVFAFETPTTISASQFRGNQVTASAASNSSAQAGAVLFQTTPGDLTISDSTFASNQVTATSSGTHEVDALAGALKVTVGSGKSLVTISGTSFTGNQVTATATANQAVATGGALSVDSGNQVVHLKSSQILDSTLTATGATKATAKGGGIDASGALMVIRSVVSGNTLTAHSGSDAALALGGGLESSASGTTTVKASTIAGNTAHALSDASGAAAGGGGIGSASTVKIVLQSSTVSTNTVSATASAASAEALGGGLNLESATAADRVVNSTITGNHASVSGPNSDAAGAAIEIVDKKLSVRFATIASNDATATGANAFAGGGGLDVEQGTTTLEATILASNAGVTGPNCLGAVASSGFNLVGATTGCTFGTTGTDQTNTAPMLGPLANNGGSTMTLALLPGSPAIDEIPAAICQAIVTTDQRGVARPQGATCDEGAFELAP